MQVIVKQKKMIGIPQLFSILRPVQTDIYSFPICKKCIIQIYVCNIKNMYSLLQNCVGQAVPDLGGEGPGAVIFCGPLTLPY